MKKALAAREINAFKNEAIWKLITDSRVEEAGVRKEVEERASSVIRELSTEVEGLTDRLKRYKLICFYCGLRMNPDTVNLECELNKVKNVTPERRF